LAAKRARRWPRTPAWTRSLYRIGRHRPRDHGLGRRQPQADQPGTGRKSPNIVFADADLDKAARMAVVAAFANSGQECSAGTRLRGTRRGR
jgi:hypothetical protein